MKTRIETPNTSAGFTIVELALVVAAIGILAFISIPKFLQVNDFQQEMFLRETLAAVRYAQKLAVGSGCPTRIIEVTHDGVDTIDLQRDTNVPCNQGAPSWQSVRHPSRSGTPGFRPVPRSGLAPTAVKDLGVTGFVWDGLGSDPNQIIFDPLGQPTSWTQTDDLKIQIKVPIGTSPREITITSQTGHAYLD